MNTRHTLFLPKFFTWLVLCLLVVLVPNASAQVDQWGAWENGITESWWLSSKTFTNEQAATAIERWKKIGANADEKSWQGDYFQGGETHGTYLRWSASEGFIIVDVDKCQALAMSVMYGSVEVTPTAVMFLPEFRSSRNGHGRSRQFPKFDITFVPVKWQDMLFLIPRTQVPTFADSLAGLGDFNGLIGFNGFLGESHFYGKYAGAKNNVGDTPILPANYQQLIKKPILATITSVNGRRLKRNYFYEFNSPMLSFSQQHKRASLTFVTVNVGTEQGAKNGLLLKIIKPDLGEMIRLTKVGPTSSTGLLVMEIENGKEMFYNEGRNRVYPRVAVGWKLTTAPR